MHTIIVCTRKAYSLHYIPDTIAAEAFFEAVLDEVPDLDSVTWYTNNAFVKSERGSYAN